jgi:hypothetical protein
MLPVQATAVGDRRKRHGTPLSHELEAKADRGLLAGDPTTEIHRPTAPWRLSRRYVATPVSTRLDTKRPTLTAMKT